MSTVKEETPEQIADSLIDEWFDAPDGYRGMVLLDEERASLSRMIVSALRNERERAAMIAETHDKDGESHFGSCKNAIAAAIREGRSK